MIKLSKTLSAICLTLVFSFNLSLSSQSYDDCPYGSSEYGNNICQEEPANVIKKAATLVNTNLSSPTNKIMAAVAVSVVVAGSYLLIIRKSNSES